MLLSQAGNHLLLQSWVAAASTALIEVTTDTWRCTVCLNQDTDNREGALKASFNDAFICLKEQNYKGRGRELPPTCSLPKWLEWCWSYARLKPEARTLFGPPFAFTKYEIVYVDHIFFLHFRYSRPSVGGHLVDSAT